MPDQCVPCRQRRAGQRGGLLKPQVIGRAHQAALLSKNELTEHPLHRSSTCGLHDSMSHATRRPFFEKCRHDPVSRLPSGDTLSCIKHLPCPIGTRRKGQRQVAWSLPARGAEIPVVERYCTHLHKHLTRTRLGSRDIDELQASRSGDLGDLPCFHATP